MAIDLNKSNVSESLPAELSSEVWAKAVKDSVVLQLAQRMTLPGNGVEVPIITGEPTATWTTETGKIETSKPTFTTKTMRGYKVSMIVPFSNEFKRDLNSLYSAIIDRAPQALGRAIDQTVFGIKTAPGEGFATLKDCAKIDASAGLDWAKLVSADAKIAEADGEANAWVLSPSAKSQLLTATDTTGRPLYVSNMTTDGAMPALLGQPTYFTKNITGGNVIGCLGDWTSAVVGIVEDIKMSVSDQASVTIDGQNVNLFEHEMFAVKFVMEIGFQTKFDDHFVLLTGSGSVSDDPEGVVDGNIEWADTWEQMKKNEIIDAIVKLWNNGRDDNSIHAHVYEGCNLTKSEIIDRVKQYYAAPIEVRSLLGE